MKDKKNDSFSLLNQIEIDTLVKFLTDKKLDSDVMSQHSIDKLINLIRTDHEHLALNLAYAYSDIDTSGWNNLNFRSSVDEPCELHFSKNDDTGIVSLTVYNESTKQETALTPNNFDKNDTTDWGLFIPPMSFCQIAYMLSIKFTQETYDSVCSTYAKFSYNDETHKIPEIFLPENDILVSCIL